MRTVQLKSIDRHSRHKHYGITFTDIRTSIQYDNYSSSKKFNSSYGGWTVYDTKISVQAYRNMPISAYYYDKIRPSIRKIIAHTIPVSYTKKY